MKRATRNSGPTTSTDSSGGAYTAILGVVFLIGQFVAWWRILGAGQMMTNTPHSSFFFIFSGLHGVHILVGLAGLGALLVRTR